MQNEQNNRGRGRIYLPSYKTADGVKKKSHVFWIEYWFRGRQCRENSHSKKRSDSVKLLNERLGEMATGKLVRPDADKVTFENLVQMVLDDYKLKENKSLDRAKRAISHLRDFFGLHRAVEITSDLITKYRLKRQDKDRDGAKPATIRYELALLKHGFMLAIRAEKLLRKPYFEPIKVQNARKGFFEESEFLAVKDHLDPDLASVITAAYCTGWRVKSELLPLKWKGQVDFEAQTIRLEPGTTKSGEGRTFPYGSFPMLKEVIDMQWERTKALQKATNQLIPWVFHRKGEQIKDFRGAWESACKKAGVPGRIVHDFRRTAIRNLERAGVSRSVAMKLVGHETESVYRRYAIVSESDLNTGVQKLALLHGDQHEAAGRVVEIGSRKVPAK